MNPTYESERYIVNPMHSSSQIAETATATETVAGIATVTEDVFDPIEAFNVFQFEMSETDEQSRIDEIRRTVQNCPIHPINRARREQRENQNENQTIQMHSHNHQCKVCHCFGHEIKNCTDPLVVGQLHQDKNIFRRLLTNRIREPESIPEGISIEFCNFIIEMHTTPKNLLKYLVMQYGGKTRRVSKTRLTANYISYMFHDYISVSLLDGVFTSDSYTHTILIAEEKYWLNIGNGMPMLVASEIYENSLSEIISAASVLNELLQANESYEDRSRSRNRSRSRSRDSESDSDPFENLDIQMIPIEHLTLIDNFECCICFETINEIDSVELNCEHSFCGVCVSKIINNCNKNNTTPKCSLCRIKYTQLKIKNENTRNILSKKIIK